MIATARRHNRLLVANLMQRYNPLYQAVARLIASRTLGELLHGYFENLRLRRKPAAGALVLGPVQERRNLHRARRAFLRPVQPAGWATEPLSQPQRGIRPGSAPPIEEHVQCTVRYGPTVFVNFYHGFHQTGRMDRQELRLVFERGDVTLYDWVPTRARVHAIADEAQTRSLCEIFPGARLDVSASYSPRDRACQGRHKSLDVYQMIELSWGDGTNKSHRYGELLRALLGRSARVGARPFSPANDHRSQWPRLAGRRRDSRPARPGRAPAVTGGRPSCPCNASSNGCF